MIKIGKLINFPKLTQEEIQGFEKIQEEAYKKMCSYVLRIVNNKDLNAMEKHARIFALKVICTDILDDIDKDME